MKKTALVLGFLLTTLAAAWAQSNSDGTGFRFGVQASPTWSWMGTSDKNIEGAGSNWGLKLGVLGEIYFAPRYAIFTGLGFGFNQGGTLQSGYASGVYWPESDLSSPSLDTLSRNAKLHYRVNYVEIPLGLKLRGGPGEDSPLQYYAEIPVFTLGFKTKAIGDIRGTQSQNSEDEDISDDVSPLALSWGLGGGIEYELSSSTMLMVGLAYQSQFTDLTRDKGSVLRDAAGNTWEKEDSKATLGLIALRLGLFF